jgi:hypothetical protein
MSEINYLKKLYYIRWCRLVACERYKNWWMILIVCMLKNELNN